jgi:hypothetical protein
MQISAHIRVSLLPRRILPGNTNCRSVHLQLLPYDVLKIKPGARNFKYHVGMCCAVDCDR